MKLHIITALAAFSSMLLLGGCAIDHADYVKNMDKLDASEYSKIQVGNVQNFTAVKMRVFDRKQQNEISNSDDPGVQAQIANHGNVAYYTDNTAPTTQRFIQALVPEDAHSSWDKYAVRDIVETPELNNYVALGKTIIKGGVKTADEKDYAAKITDKGEYIEYSDADYSSIFKKRPMPNTDVHTDWDTYYIAEDEKVAIFKSTKKGIYRFGFTDENGALNYWEFIPMASGFQSTQKGSYRALMYYTETRKWYTFDYLPTKKLICFDLARAYDTATNARNQELTRAAFTGIAIALGGYSTSTFSGTAQSDYSGYYAGENWSGTGTHQYTGYAKTYNYAYLAAGAAGVIDAAFKTNAPINNIRAAMEQQQCEFEL